MSEGEETPEKRMEKLGEAAYPIACAFERLFGTPDGETVLKQLEGDFGVVWTQEPEEQQGRPIDPLAFAKRQGKRAAYNQIVTWIRHANTLRK